MTEQIQCRACPAIFESYKELAQHIISLKDLRHKKGRRWALKFITKQKILDQKRDLKPRTAMPENIKSHFDEIKRITSGEMLRGQARCPQCKGTHITEVDREYLEDDGDFIWRNSKNELMILCAGCRR